MDIDSALLNAEIVFKEKKKFWNVQTHIEIIILAHENHNCLEMITFCNDSQAEGERVYFSIDLLVSKLNKISVKNAFANKRLQLQHEKEEFEEDKLYREVSLELAAEMIVSRMSIVNPGEFFLVEFELQSSDGINPETNQWDVLCDRPLQLIGTNSSK